MTDYQAPHEVRNEEKLQSMIATLQNGGQLPPVVVIGDYALTGSHRIAAWDACEMQAEIVELSDDDYVAACEELYGEVMTIDEIGDFSQFCEAIYNITADKEVKAALSDQID